MPLSRNLESTGRRSIHRSPASGRSARLLPLVLAAAACASAPPPPPELLPAALREIPEPVAAIGERLAAMEPLLETAAGEGESAAEAGRTLDRLAREVAMLCGRPELDDRPLTRGELRARVFVVTAGTADERKAGLEACRTLEARLARPPSAAGAQR